MPNKPQRPNNSAQMDTVSESGFKMPNFNLSSKLNNIGSFYRNRKKPRSQSININPCANVVDADSPSIDGAMFFLSSSNGLCGNLSFGKKSILFEFGRDLGESHSANSSIPLDPTEPKCPIKEEPVRNSYAIDFLNIGDIYAEQSTDHLSITIFCQNFKHVKISLKQSEIASAIIDKIKTISFDNMVQSNVESRICLWEYLYQNYPYRQNSDWVEQEKWYISNFKIRLTNFNEIGTCNSLPDTIIVPRDLQDHMLDRLASLSVGNRVPLITFLYRKSSHMIVRCSFFREQNLQDLVPRSTITPLRELSIDAIFAELNDIEKQYSRLRKHCFAVTKQSDHLSTANQENEHESKFWSKCSHWLYALSKVLRFVTTLVNIVKHEATAALTESNDNRWNCVLSSLVQIVLDPHRRTVAGFESLLSKEWIYLSGYKSRSPGSNRVRQVNHLPNSTFFILFLDCVHQLIAQNPRSFEFTTIYLISLVDMQFTTDSFKREAAKRFEVNKAHSLICNPLYTGSRGSTTADSEEPQINAHITQIRFFYLLFFRHIKSDTLKFLPAESVLWNEALRRSLV